MASKHTIIAYCPFGLESDALEVWITYLFTPGRPAVMYLRNGDPGYPADPAEVELVSAKLVYHPINDAMQKMLDEWAVEFLADDEGYQDACFVAEANIWSERERAAEMRAERAKEEHFNGR